jgi:hypothetical protein
MWHLLAISLTVLLVLILVVLYHLYYVEMPVSDFVSTPMGMEHMFDTIVYFTRVVFLIPILVISINAVRMYRFTMRGKERVRIPLRFYLIEAWTIIYHMVSHKNITKCLEAIHKKRWRKHWLLGLGCSLMFVVLFFFLKWFQTDSIYPLYHPQRWLGYIAAVGLIVVPLDILIGRVRKRTEMHKFSEFSDLTLPTLLLLSAVTGIAVHIFRYAGFELTCHYVYAIHLAVSVPLLVIEIPFGKLSHVIYRPVALYFQAVKERAIAEEEHLVEPIPKEAVTA